MSLQIILTIALGILALTLASVQLVICMVALSKTYYNEEEEVTVNE